MKCEKIIYRVFAMAAGNCKLFVSYCSMDLKRYYYWPCITSAYNMNIYYKLGFSRCIQIVKANFYRRTAEITVFSFISNTNDRAHTI